MPLVTRVRRATADRRTNGPASSNIHVQHGRWGRAKASAPAGKRPNISRPKGRPWQYPRLPTSFLLREEQPLLPLSSQRLATIIPVLGAASEGKQSLHCTRKLPGILALGRYAADALRKKSPSYRHEEGNWGLSGTHL